MILMGLMVLVGGHAFLTKEGAEAALEGLWALNYAEGDSPCKGKQYKMGRMGWKHAEEVS